jgi:hypothetical protein
MAAELGQGCVTTTTTTGMRTAMLRVSAASA